MFRLVLASALVWGAMSWAQPSHATPPGSWAVSIERLFGASRVTTRYDVSGVELTETSLSWFSDPAPHTGYSSPRLALDYLTPFGLSLGGALGYHQLRVESEIPAATPELSEHEATSRALVLAPRVGYFAQPLPRVGVWPRAGLTRVWLKDRERENETAVTLELPLLWLLAGGQVGIVLTPHLDLGLHAGSSHISEYGVQAGATAFF